MKITAPVVWLMILSGLFFTGMLIYTITGAPVSAGFETLFVFGAGWAVAWWILDDCRERRMPVSIDHGWFVQHFWLFMLPRHLLQTRGAAGCVIGGFLVLLFLIVVGLARLLLSA